MRSEREIAVVHLIRRRNGLAPFKSFLASYTEQAPGMPHDLVLIFKGFRFADTEDFDRLLAGIPHTRLFLGDRGFDLSPYLAAARELEFRYFCFLNSYSRILCTDWLSMLYSGITVDGVGLAGATGSYQSYATNHLERNLMLSRLAPAKRLAWRVKHVVQGNDMRLVTLRAGAWMLGSLGLWDPGRYFPPFPNYHVRTNAFMMSRETLARIRTWPMIFKMSTQFFESGHESLTNQVLRLGLRAVVVSSTGKIFGKEDWHLSNTFRQGAQEDLLVSDNQTRDYDNADFDRRAELCKQTWGRFALDGQDCGQE